MSFTFEKLNRLNLKRGEWIHIKYPSFDYLVSGQVATCNAFNIQKYAIFDSSKTKFYFHLPSQTHPSELDIEKIEILFRPSSKPLICKVFEKLIRDLKNFEKLTKGITYEFLKTNGNIEALKYDSIVFEQKNTNDFEPYLKGFNQIGTSVKLDFNDIIDVL